MIKKQGPKSVPPELNETTHTMCDLAQVEDTAIVKPIPYPPPEPGLSLGGVHTADGGVLPTGLNLDGFKKNPEGPFNSVGVDHLVGLARIRGVKGGKPHRGPTLNTRRMLARITAGSPRGSGRMIGKNARELPTYLFFDDMFPSAQISDSIPRSSRFYHFHKRSPNPFESSPTRYFFERNDVSQARVAGFVASVSRVGSVGLRVRLRSLWGWNRVAAALLSGRFETFIFHREVSVRNVDSTESI